VPEENFWALWCKGRLTEADTPTIRLGATASGLTSAHLHHPPFFYRPDALPATILRPFFWDYPGELMPEELDFMVQGKITEADTPTIQLGATPSRLISDPTPSSPNSMPDALPVATFPLYPGLEWHQICWIACPVAWFRYLFPPVLIPKENL